MYLLAGLMGFMALGSVALVSIGDPDEELSLDDGDDPDLLPYEHAPDSGMWMGPDDEVLEDGRSLFDRMGLINMPGMDAPVGADFFGGVQDDETPESALAGTLPDADVLKLHGYRLLADDELPSEPDVVDGALPMPADPEADTLLDYDAEQDQLLIVFDDSAGGPEPDVDMRVSDDNPDMTEIRLGDAVLARLPTNAAPPLSSIVLVGENDAVALGLTG